MKTDILLSELSHLIVAGERDATHLAFRFGYKNRDSLFRALSRAEKRGRQDAQVIRIILQNHRL